MLVPARISPSNAPQQSPIHRGRCRLAAQVCNGDLRPILEFEFGQDRADVVADRPFPHIGGRGDLLVVEALRDKLDDFVFSIGELGECVRASIRPLGFSGMAGKVDSVYRLALKHAFAAHHLGEPWFNPAKLVCDMFNRLYFFEDLGPFLVRAGALALMASVFVVAAVLIFGRSRYEHL